MKLIWKEENQTSGREDNSWKQAWPSGFFTNDLPAVLFLCKDGYDPAIAESGLHSPLTVLIAVYTSDAEFTWRTLKKPADTLELAKTQAMGVFTRHPEYFPLSLRSPRRRAGDPPKSE